MCGTVQQRICIDMTVRRSHSQCSSTSHRQEYRSVGGTRMRSQRTTLGWSQRVRMAASRSARLASSRERKMSSVHLRATTRWPSLAAYSIDARMSLYRGVRFPTATTNTGGWEAHENAAVGAGAHLPLDAVGGEDLVRVVGAPAGQLNSWSRRSGSSWLSGSWRRSRDAAASVVADAERVHRRADEAGHRKARCNRSGNCSTSCEDMCRNPAH